MEIPAKKQQTDLKPASSGGSVMRRIFLTILLPVLAVGFVRAQEATGEKAEQVKKEILKFQQEEIQALASSTSSNNYAPEWLERVDADDIDYIDSSGVFKTKAEVIAGFRSGKHLTLAVRQSNVHVRVYGNGGNGTTVVVTSLFESDHPLNDGRGMASLGVPHGQIFTITANATDVYLKIDGQWRWIVHHHSLAPRNP